MKLILSRRAIIIASLFVALTERVPAQSAWDLYRITDGVTRTETAFHPVSVPIGREVVLADLKGPGKVTYFYITDDTIGKWYPGLVLNVFWDDATEPSICVPLSDFFGAVAGRSVDYQSAVMQINHACFMCYLPMPFSQRARFVLANDGDPNYSQKVAYGIDFEQRASSIGEKSRLHCEWRRSNPVRNGLHTSPGTEDEYGSCWEDPNWRRFSSAVRRSLIRWPLGVLGSTAPRSYDSCPLHRCPPSRSRAPTAGGS